MRAVHKMPLDGLLTYMLTSVMRRVSFYRDRRGTCPIEDFLDGLPAKDAQKVTWVLRLIEQLDVIPGSYLKKLVGTTALWEVRSRTGNNAYRLLCFIEDDEIVVLTNGFRKKSQKTPRQEIALAERRRAEWIRRKR